MNEKQLYAILGEYMRYMRKNDGLSLDNLSDDFSVTKGYLSRIENGKQNLSFTKIEEITSLFAEKSLEEDLRNYEEMGKLLNEWFHYYVAFDYERLQEAKKKYYEKLKSYKGPICFFISKLLMYLLDNLTDSMQLEDLEKIVIDNLEVYTEEQTGIFYILMIRRCLNSDEKTKDAAQWLNRLKQNLEIYKSPLQEAMFNYLSAQYYLLDLEVPKGMICVHEALSFFKETMYYTRITYLNILNLNYMVYVGEAEEAEQQYLNMLSLSQNKNIEVVLYDNLAWNAFVNKEYEKCLEYINEARNRNSKFTRLDLFEVISLLMLNRKRELQVLLYKLLEKGSKRKDYQYLFEAILNLQNEQKTLFKKNIAKAWTQAKHRNEMEIIAVILKIKLNYYKQENDILGIMRTQEEIIHHMSIMRWF